MIKSIYIKNFALIEELKLNFEQGFTVITGETGAGKSIILGALGLLLGDRADSSSVRTNSKKCIIEAEFSNNLSVDKFIEKNNLDNYHNLLIRREISSSQRSRSFINDTPVNLNSLKEIGELLIDINSQHQTVELQKGDFQLGILDAVAKNETKLSEYKNIFTEYKELKSELRSLKELQSKQKADMDYIEFVSEELENLNYVKGEYDQLEEELMLLTNAEKIKENLYSSSNILNENDVNIISSIDELESLFNSISEFSSKLKDISDRLKSVKIELQDVNSEIEFENDKIEYNTERLTEVSERIDEVNRLTTKHNLKEADELIEKKEYFEEQLTQISSYDERIKKLEISISQLEIKLKSSAEKISFNRKQASPQLSKNIEALLNDLSMEDAKFKVEIETRDIFKNNGIDEVEFLFSANKGHDVQEISKVASGGELSRLMLGLKTIISKKDKNVTLVFDEIDSGLSGKVATKVGKLLKRISEEKQLISITHQAQIAAMGNNHYKVFKNTDDNSSKTSIVKLSKDERLDELSVMLGGEKSKSAISTAKELLN